MVLSPYRLQQSTGELCPEILHRTLTKSFRQVWPAKVHRDPLTRVIVQQMGTFTLTGAIPIYAAQT